MIQRPRGTKDIYGSDELIYRFIFETFESLAQAYNIKKIITPTFESYQLFKNSNGEQSDIVSKEIYYFKDKSDRELALKPEGTAPIGRAIIENKLYSNKDYNKLYYIDSMYRYEKPQKGRLRQFYQIGVEFTSELNKNTIVDCICLAKTLLEKLNIKDFVLKINNIGTLAERNQYVNELKKYFRKNKELLSKLSQTRIETNPLRILDDKEDSKLEVVKQCPKISDFWSEQTRQEFQQILGILDFLKIQYEIDLSLVRGLDYYSNIVFEFVSQSKSLGSKLTIIGGGCYLNLIKDNDVNITINGVGFGVGVERLFEILKESKKEYFNFNLDVFFVIESEEQYQDVYKLISNLRRDSIKVEFNYTFKKFKKNFDEALKSKSTLIVFQELDQKNTKKWTIKKDKNNIEVELANLEKNIKNNL